MTRRRHLELCPMLDPELWDEPAELGALDWLEALGNDRPPSRCGDEGGRNDTD